MAAVGVGQEWPQSGLESVGFCEVCSSTHSSIMYEDLEDTIFQAAPGRWTLRHCDGCGSAYLNPRPTKESIHVAYEDYYTHSIDNSDLAFLRAPNGIAHQLRRRIRNACLNDEYGLRLLPSFPFEHMVARATGARGRHVAYNIRHLPRPTEDSRELLDVGCGNGAFLKIANTLGYRAVGLEADEEAVAVAAAHGLSVEHGSVPDAPLPKGSYNQITVSHVIEHLHSPKTAMSSLLSALRPGGRIWLQTPNVEAQGLAEFGRNWRGLEPPRHLWLFSPASLERLLLECGFCNCRLLEPPKQVEWFHKQSACLQAGLSPYSDRGNDFMRKLKIRGVRKAERAVKRNPSTAETVTMIAYRP